jgi:hypothetical protein
MSTLSLDVTDIPIESYSFLTAGDLRAIERLADEHEDGHFLNTIRGIEILLRRTASTSTLRYAMYDILPFTFTSFTTDFGAFKLRVARHLEQQGFRACLLRDSNTIVIGWDAAPKPDGAYRPTVAKSGRHSNLGKSAVYIPPAEKEALFGSNSPIRTIFDKKRHFEGLGLGNGLGNRYYEQQYDENQYDENQYEDDDPYNDPYGGGYAGDFPFLLPSQQTTTSTRTTGTRATRSKSRSRSYRRRR